MSRPGADVALINRDVEAGLAELFFNIDFALVLEGIEAVAHPVELGAGETALGDVDGGAGEMGAGNVADCRSSISIGTHQALLVGDRADGRADLESVAELRLMRVRQVGEKRGGPGPAIAPVLGQTRIHRQTGRLGNTDELAIGDAGAEVGIIFNAFEVVGVGLLVLADQRFKRATQGRHGHDACVAEGIGGHPERGLLRGSFGCSDAVGSFLRRVGIGVRGVGDFRLGERGVRGGNDGARRRSRTALCHPAITADGHVGAHDPGLPAKASTRGGGRPAYTVP